MRFGWRVVRHADAKGGMSVEWRCPSCWDKYKASRPAKIKNTLKRGP
jgi:hypothetical protein